MYNSLKYILIAAFVITSLNHTYALEIEEESTVSIDNIEDSMLDWDKYAKAAQQGDLESQYILGTIYRDGKGITQDYKEAAYWFRKAGRNGHALAQYNIALLFANGNGVLQDWRIAGEWYWRAAQQDVAEAQYALAVMYRDGIGMKQDYHEAKLWFEKAATHNYKDAAYQADIIPQTKSNKKSKRK